MVSIPTVAVAYSAIASEGLVARNTGVFTRTRYRYTIIGMVLHRCPLLVIGEV